MDNVTRKELFILHAMGNSNIVTGKAPEHQIKKWFGNDSYFITTDKIASKQAIDFAEEMIYQLEKQYKN
jgi:hypothetical protein